MMKQTKPKNNKIKKTAKLEEPKKSNSCESGERYEASAAALIGKKALNIKVVDPKKIEKYLLSHPAVPFGIDKKANRIINRSYEVVEGSDEMRAYCAGILDNSGGEIFLKNWIKDGYAFGTAFSELALSKEKDCVVKCVQKHPVYYGYFKQPIKGQENFFSVDENLAIVFDTETGKPSGFCPYIYKDNTRVPVKEGFVPYLKVAALKFDTWGDEIEGISIVQYIHENIQQLLNIEDAGAEQLYRNGFTQKKFTTNIRSVNKLKDFSKTIADMNESDAIVLLDGTDVENLQPGNSDFVPFHKEFMGLLGIALGIPTALLTLDGCHDKDTEVLTETGWKRYWNVGGEDLIACYDKDSNLISYEKPKDFILYKYKGKMHKYENKVTSMLVTPNHRMLWKPETKNAEFTTCLSEDLKNKWFRFKTNAKWKSVKELVSFIIPSYKSKMVNCPEKKVDVSKLMTLFGWYFSEGCSIYNQVRISQSDDKYADEIRKFLNSTGFEIIEFSDERRENTCRDFRIKHAGLANYLKQFGLKANEKVLPAWIKNLDSESIELFLDSFLKGDGSIDRNGHKIFYTSSKKMADDLQELVFKTGKKSSIKTIKSENKCDMYGVHVSERIVGESNPSEEETRLSQDENYSVEEYNDYVWCFDTPTGFFVTRRNGKIAIQGNSNVNKASLGEMRSEMYQDSFADELVVKKTIDEEIFAVACRLKNPGIKDEDIPKFVFKKRKVEVGEELELKKLWSEIVINITKAAKDLAELGHTEASKSLVDNIDDFNSENTQPIQALFEEKADLKGKKKGWFSKK